MPFLIPIVLWAAAAANTTKPVRVVIFVGGTTTVDAAGGVDHVVVHDSKGNLTADSYCDSATFDEYFAFFTKFKDAVSRSDRHAVIYSLVYPLRVATSKPIVLPSAASLLKRYDKILTAHVQEKIRNAEPATVFCRNGRAMFGDGIVWASPRGIDILNF